MKANSKFTAWSSLSKLISLSSHQQEANVAAKAVVAKTLAKILVFFCDSSHLSTVFLMITNDNWIKITIIIINNNHSLSKNTKYLLLKKSKPYL